MAAESSMLDQFGSGRNQKHKYYQYGSQLHNEPIIAHPYKSSAELFSDTKPIDITYDEAEFDEQEFKFSWKRLLQFVGPGWLMSIAYIDSGNLESDIQAGAMSGYSLIWILFWSTIIGWLLQSLCARLAVVTGQSLAELCRYEYNGTISIVLWIFMELSIIGSDIQQVIGTAIAFHILFGLKLWVGCILTAIAAFILLAVNSWKGLRCMEYFFLSVIASMSILFIVECFISAPDFLQILKGWVLPLINDADNTYVQEQAIGIVGAVIMPFNLFLHSSLVQLRNISRDNKAAIREANFYFSMEAGLSLLISFLINLCVLSVFAKGFYENPDFDARDAGLLTAGYYLNTRFGEAAKYVWALGLLASGQSATMTGTFAGQYVMNGFLNLKWPSWARTLMTRSIALVPSLIVALFATEKFDIVNEWINVEQSVILPFALLPLLFFSCNTRIMGNSFVLGMKLRIFYGIIGAIVVFINVYLVCLFIIAWDVGDNLTLFGAKWFILSTFLWIYLGFIGWLFWDFLKQRAWRASDDKFELYGDIKMHIDQNKLDDDNEEYVTNGEHIQLTNTEEDDDDDMQDSKPLLAGQH